MDFAYQAVLRLVERPSSLRIVGGVAIDEGPTSVPTPIRYRVSGARNEKITCLVLSPRISRSLFLSISLSISFSLTAFDLTRLARHPLRNERSNVRKKIRRDKNLLVARPIDEKPKGMESRSRNLEGKSIGPWVNFIVFLMVKKIIN